MKDFSGVFTGYTQFNEDISGWDVSNATTMHRMFSNAKRFNKSLNDWNVSKVRDMTHMVCAASEFNGNISDWNTSAVKCMNGMFFVQPECFSMGRLECDRYGLYVLQNLEL